MIDILRLIARNIYTATAPADENIAGSFFDIAYEKSHVFRENAHRAARAARAAIEPLLTPSAEMHVAGHEARMKALRCDPDSECVVHYRAMLTAAMGQQA